MAKLEYKGKSQEYDYGTGLPSATKVILGTDAGAFVPILLAADKINLSNTELYELAMQQLYEENFPNKAENEKFSAVDEKMEEIEKRSKANEDKFADMEGKFKVMMGTMGDLVLKYQESLLSDEESDQEESEETHETTDNTETHEQENQGNN